MAILAERCLVLHLLDISSHDLNEGFDNPSPLLPPSP